ncbi:hypothetical protein H2200_001062 [Cladophialophora chaetospira]|uniref:Uncharacterized protein n=1 Tax=Cladophialophora chaetospira TaxID=386627 RepID=A0AA38XKA0_9EURO|nr:hypothetical protein H2200_001062 [Cladophialophora chaetospira]
MALLIRLVSLANLLCLAGLALASGGHGRGQLLPAGRIHALNSDKLWTYTNPESTRFSRKAEFFHDCSSKRVTIKYGAVTVPPMTESDGMAQFFQRSTTLPCQDCYITWLQMGLEHVDGRTADADTGMWLHHGVMLNRNRTDAVCGTTGQRIAASGNERTAIDMSAGGLFKSGYYIGAADEVSLVVDVMNMSENNTQDDIVFTITYEFIDASHAGDFSPVTTYWLDVGGCGDSDQPAYRDSTFNYMSPVFRGAQEGTITFVGGHLHDGGTHIDFIKNGEVACSSSATYEAYRNVDEVGTTDHISSIDTCTMAGETNPGDEWLINAYYDTSVHKPMTLMDGSLEPVMGIMLVYVAEDVSESVLSRPKYWTIVFGVGGLAAVVMSIAAWLSQREKRSYRIQLGGVHSPLYKDSNEEQESAVPLMNA